MLLGTFGLEKAANAGAATGCASPKARQNTRLQLRPRTPVCCGGRDVRARWWGRAAPLLGLALLRESNGVF